MLVSSQGQRCAEGPSLDVCIGMLSVRNIATMRFYADFLETFDDTGALIKSLLRDPKTKELVIFGREKDVSHNSFGGVVVLPLFALDHPFYRTSVKPGARGPLTPEQEADWEDKCFRDKKARARKRLAKGSLSQDKQRLPQVPQAAARKSKGRRVRIKSPPAIVHLPGLGSLPAVQQDGRKKALSAEQVQKMLQDCRGCQETVAEIRKRLRTWDVGYFWNDLYLREVYIKQIKQQCLKGKPHPWKGETTAEDAALDVQDLFLEERQRLESIEEMRNRYNLGPPVPRVPHPPDEPGRQEPEVQGEQLASRARRVSVLLRRAQQDSGVGAASPRFWATPKHPADTFPPALSLLPKREGPKPSAGTRGSGYPSDHRGSGCGTAAAAGLAVWRLSRPPLPSPREVLGTPEEMGSCEVASSGPA
ncbi:uncharacterized protein [Struthio camelus]|uniref:uncharacterized protein n=1 Tax=Struthio camelus TaxID=8801 RepID=UPI003603C4AE